MAIATETDIDYPKNYSVKSDLPKLLKNMALSIQDIIDSFVFTPIGSGMDYYGTTAPNNYLFADGSAISRTEYAELFSVIGTTYGAGDGSTTFNLPDKRTRVSVMRSAGDDTFATLGAKGGEKKHTLTVSEMPSHTHTQNSHSHTMGRGNDNNLGTGANQYGWQSTDDKSGAYATNGTTATNQNTGGGQSHNNLQPYFVCNYIIKVK